MQANNNTYHALAIAELVNFSEPTGSRQAVCSDCLLNTTNRDTPLHSVTIKAVKVKSTTVLSAFVITHIAD